MTPAIRAVVPEGYTWFFLRNPPAEIDALLHDELSYFKEGAEFSDAYRNGNWDGRARLYDRETHGAPVGLLGRTIGLLEERGYRVSVDVRGDRSGDPIDVEWHFDHDLWDHQAEAVGDVLAAGGGVAAIPTAGGKTAIALKLIEAVGQRAIVLVHTKELLYQWEGRIRDVLGVDPGIIGDGSWTEGPVTVAIMQSLVSRGPDDLGGAYGMAIFDEAHRTSAADKMHKVGMVLDVEWRVGLSATPWRRVDGAELKIEGATGGVVSSATAADLIDAGILAEPEFRLIDPADHGVPPEGRDGEDYHDIYQRCLVDSLPRNRAIVETASELAQDGYTVFVAVHRIDHGEHLAGAIPGAVFLSGEDSTDRRQDVLESFDAGELPVLVSTLLKEGVDLPAMNAIVLAGGQKSDVMQIQQIGRALRPAGGDHAVVCDVRDRGRYLAEHFDARQDVFASYYAEYGPDWRDPGVQRVRSWLSRNGIDLEAVQVHRDAPQGRIAIEKVGYIDDFDHFLSVMRSTSAVSYDGEVNYVRNPDRLPEPVVKV